MQIITLIRLGILWKPVIKCNKNLITELTPPGQLSNYSVKFALIRGHVYDSGGYMDDFFTLICKEIETNKRDIIFLQKKGKVYHYTITNISRSRHSGNKRVCFKWLGTW